MNAQISGWVIATGKVVGIFTFITVIIIGVGGALFSKESIYKKVKLIIFSLVAACTTAIMVGGLTYYFLNSFMHFFSGNDEDTSLNKIQISQAAVPIPDPEPQAYDAEVIQVGGVGSRIVSKVG